MVLVLYWNSWKKKPSRCKTKCVFFIFVIIKGKKKLMRLILVTFANPLSMLAGLPRPGVSVWSLGLKGQAGWLLDICLGQKRAKYPCFGYDGKPGEMASSKTEKWVESSRAHARLSKFTSGSRCLRLRRVLLSLRLKCKAVNAKMRAL